jgi:hypothetical protein
MGLEFDIDVHGALFDGRAEAATEAFREHIENQLAELAVTRIRAFLPTQYMYLGNNGGTPMFNPVPPDAGLLASQVHAERATADSTLVTDDPVTYGPWIEGVSDLNMVVWPHRRNPPPRRFPGYGTFRKIASMLEAETEEIAEREIQPYIEEMNQ